MKRKNKLISFIAIALCLCITFGSGTIARAETDIDNDYRDVYTEDESVNIFLDFAKAFFNFLFSVYQDNNSVSNGKGDTVKVKVPFFIVPFQESPGFFKNIKSLLLIGTKVKVLGYSGDYTYVEVVNTGEKGYIFYYFLDDNRDGELTLSRGNDNVYVGKTNSGRLKAVYTGDETLTWSVKPAGYIERNAKTGIITGIKPGIVTVTAKAGKLSKQCTVACINEWKETETATAQKSITIRANPGNSYESKGTISKGTTITALGDLADGSGWIYVEANGIWGFIQLSDFPGIDYLFTEYHYYDKGYDVRFNNVNNRTASENIYLYASVMNDVMMDLFNLKVCPYVSPYTSPADQCKIWRYGSVKLNNLASSCTKTEKHNSNSCLTRDVLRAALYNNGNGAGNDLVAKAVWTGHIMDGHKRSNSQRNPTYILVFTTGNTVNKGTYTNKSTYSIRYYSIYELLHETAHQFGTHDHYCYDEKNGDVCVNPYCYRCTKNTAPPFCIMNKPFDVELYDNDKLFCSECKEIIKNHLADHH